MTTYRLGINKRGIGPIGGHDPAAVIFADDQLRFGAEEERYVRKKYADGLFPLTAIEKCLEHCGIGLGDVDELVLTTRPELYDKSIGASFRHFIENATGSFSAVGSVSQFAKWWITNRFVDERLVRQKLESAFEESAPPIVRVSHHRGHASSAFYPADFREGIVVTMDARGEYDSTVVWRANGDGLRRLRTFRYPNSLGSFYSRSTTYLGYCGFGDEGKVMGLAPYGSENAEIESRLRDVATFGRDYNVTALTSEGGTTAFTELFDRPPAEDATAFTDWERDFAHVVQSLLEETVTEIVEHYCQEYDTDNVGLAGGVALNCKANQRVRELDAVENLFVQPVANDAGVPLGGVLSRVGDHVEQSTVYFGDSFSVSDIEDLLTKNKIPYRRPPDMPAYVAKRLASGALVGWFQGRMEMGPRALGNRSILADPRTKDSLDCVNAYVKHRESWRPFAPSLLEHAAEEYLRGGEAAPFMIETYDVNSSKVDKIPAVVHPAAGDQTTRPQTVREDQNPRYHALLTEFERLTGVPVLLNTSFNDSGEPIVRTPEEALRNFYTMGLDMLVLEDLIIEK